jgi:hypothetical protein
MAEIDPLKILGMVNQFQKAPAPNKALQDLQTKTAITGMQQRGAMDRTAATNLANLEQKLLPRGLTVQQARDPINRQRLQTLDTIAQVGGGPGLAKMGVSPERFRNVRLEDLIKLPFRGTGETSSKTQAAANIQAKAGQDKKTDRLLTPGGAPFGIIKQQDTEKKEVVQKNTPLAKQASDQLLNDVFSSIQRQFPKATITNPRMEQKIDGSGTVLKIDIDGVTRTIQEIE